MASSITQKLDYKFETEASPLTSVMSATATVTQQMPAANITAGSGKRRLAARRGSVSANDPWGAHSQLNHNPQRSSSSTLTIVRVQHPSQIPQPPLNLREPPSQAHRRSAASHRNHSRQGSAGSTSGDAGQSPRMSFAFSSFGGRDAKDGGSSSRDRSEHREQQQQARPESPTSPRIGPQHPRPASPSRSRHTYAPQPRLSPEQLVDLARASTSPRPSPASASASPATPHAAGWGDTSPASFVPMAHDVYLPFIDRPGEVAALLACAPSSKLFSLLAQTFPPAQVGTPPSPALSMHSHASSSHSLSSLPARKPELSADAVPEDPLAWTYEHLLAWLTQVPRPHHPPAPGGVCGVPDTHWVRKARACILGRSELIWERVKGALGVPPELDADQEPEFSDQEYTDEEVDADDAADVFAEWDSNNVGMAERRPSTSSSRSAARSASSAGDDTEHVTSPMDYAGEHPSDFGYESDPDVMSLSIENIMAAPGDATAVSSPSHHAHAHAHHHAHSPLSNLSAPSALRHSGLSPLAGDGLSGISEDGEDEDAVRDGEKEGEDYTTARKAAGGSPPAGLKGTIQGLKISTSPLLSSGPSSPCVYPALPTHSLAHSPTTSLSGLPPLNGAGAHSWGERIPAGGLAKSGRSSSFGSVHSARSLGSIGSGSAYDPVGERGPGNPLFPSNFARLAVGPTLRAKYVPPLSPL